jgi:NAD(P)-dependent dehydrogenase (short-subunit alcohol dehydrogenase family)
MRLDQRVVVVTGAGRGNGRAIAMRCAEEGAHVVLGDIDEPAVRSVAGQIRSAGGRAEGMGCDVTSEADVAALMASARAAGGPHAVVAQAGTTFGGPLHETPLADWNRLMAVDLTGTFLTVREAVRSMLETGGGSIVTMSGTFAFMAEPGTSAHCAAKAAILAFTRAVAAEYGDRNIRCNAIVPGYVMTGMVRRLFDRSDDGEAVHAEIASWHALGRIADPREVANMALFLCSDESSFSSGSPFFVDGGLTTGINSNRHPLARSAQQAARPAD